MLTPADIQSKTFSVSRFGKAGYDQDEVDDFLDACNDTLIDMSRQLGDAENRALAAANEVTRRAAYAPDAANTAPMPVLPASVVPLPPAGGPSLDTINLLLKAAQDTADKLTADAHVQAAGIVAAANSAAAKVAADADLQRNAVVGALETQRQEYQAKVDALQAVHGQVASQMQTALAALTPPEVKP
jgi:DivIVA domain-containing protein